MNDWMDEWMKKWFLFIHDEKINNKWKEEEKE